MKSEVEVLKYRYLFDTVIWIGSQEFVLYSFKSNVIKDIFVNVLNEEKYG